MRESLRRASSMLSVRLRLYSADLRVFVLVPVRRETLAGPGRDEIPIGMESVENCQGPGRERLRCSAVVGV